MVDSIGAKPVGSEAAVTRVAATAPVQPAQTVATPTPAPSPAAADTAALSGVAQQLAASPPVDTDRVARIKKAIADGTFPILPATIADRLIALKLQWNPHDEA